MPLGPAPSAEAKAVDFLQYATVGALCDPTADVPFAALSDMTRCLGPVFTAAARVDPMGSAVVGAASLAAAAGHITPRASNGHPALLARHVLSMLKKSRQSVRDCRVELQAERADAVPAVFTRMNLHFVVTGTGLKEAHVKRAVELSAEKYCSASIMLGAAGVEVTHSYAIEEA